MQPQVIIDSNMHHREHFENAYNIFYAGVDILGYPDEYSEINLLGAGSYGVVYQFKKKNNLGSIVIKVISKQKTDISFVQEEISVLQRLRKKCSKYVLCYLSAFEDSKNYYILTEYLGNYITLWEYRDTGILNKRDKKILIENLVLGLHLIHSMGIAHRDIKPENIMINPGTLDIKYIDFGGSCDQDPCIGSMYTRLYMAPELLGPRANRPRSLHQWMKADLWSLGETIWEIVVGEARQNVWDYNILNYEDAMRTIPIYRWTAKEKRVYDLLNIKGLKSLDRESYMKNFIYNDPIVPSIEGLYENPIFVKNGQLYAFDLESLFSQTPEDRTYLKKLVYEVK